MRTWLNRQRKFIGLFAVGVIVAGCGPAEIEIGETGEAALALVSRDFETIAPRVVVATTPLVRAGRRFVVDPAARRMDGRLRVELPERAEDGITMSTDDGFTMTVHEIDAAGRGRVDRGVVTYPRADGTSIWLGADDGAEEWLYLPQGTTTGRIARYRVSGGSLRQHVTAVDIYDESGRPQATVSAPGAWDAAGEHVHVWMEAEGDTVVLRTERAVSGPLLVDPSWVKVGNMGTARRHHAAALLPSGNVLVTGGEQQLGNIHLDSAEVYDHVTKTWFPTAPMSVTRSQDCSVRLPDGRVFVGCASPSGVFYGEIYDEGSGGWVLSTSMQPSPTAGAAVMLPDGRVLMTGGALAQTYDIEADTWETVASPLANRNQHAIKLLLDGRVLIAGGPSQSGNMTAEVYDPVLDVWSAVGDMARSRGIIAPLVLFADGRVLVAGGYQSSSFPDAELFDPTTGQWTSTAPMAEDRYGHRAILREDGTALMVGGNSTTGPHYASTEVFDSATETWTPGPTMNAPRAVPTLTALAAGQLLVAGGDDEGTSVKTAEVLGGTPGEPCLEDGDCVSNACAGGICCSAGCPDLPCGSCAQLTGAPEDGTCVLFQGVDCDDGSACTGQDACTEQGCAGQAVQCPPPAECESTNFCVPQTGLCTSTLESDGTPCSMGECVGGECTGSVATSTGNTTAASSASGAGTVSGAGGGVSDAAGCNCTLDGTGQRAPRQHFMLVVAVLAYLRRRTSTSIAHRGQDEHGE